MNPPTNYLAPLEPERYYHIYNRTNNKEALYKSDENRRYFLYKYKAYLYPYLKTYAYCLLGNHFHFLVQVRSEGELLNAIKEIPAEKRNKLQKEVMSYLGDGDLTGFQNLSGLAVWQKITPHQIIAKQFQDFFTTYAKAFNKQHKRTGNLFNRPFKRVEIKDDTHFTQLIHYIHANPGLHNIHPDFRQYAWSSYPPLMSGKPSLLERKAVMAWFGGKARFAAYHTAMHGLAEMENFMIEEKNGEGAG